MINETCMNHNKNFKSVGQMGFGQAANFNQLPSYIPGYNVQKLNNYSNFFRTQFNNNTNLSFGLNKFSNMNSLGNLQRLNANFNVAAKINNLRSFPMAPLNSMKGFGLNGFNQFLKPSLNTFAPRINPLFY